MCSIIQILVQHVLCCYTTIWYCYTFRSSPIYTSPNLLLFSKIIVLNHQLPMHKMHLWQDHVHQQWQQPGQSSERPRHLPSCGHAANWKHLSRAGQPYHLPCREMGAVGREGSLSTHQGIKRLLASSFLVPGLNAGGDGQSGLLAVSEVGWIENTIPWFETVGVISVILGGWVVTWRG